MQVFLCQKMSFIYCQSKSKYDEEKEMRILNPLSCFTVFSTPLPVQQREMGNGGHGQSSTCQLCPSFLLRVRSPHALHLLHHGLHSLPKAIGPAISLLQCGLSTGSQPPSGTFTCSSVCPPWAVLGLKVLQRIVYSVIRPCRSTPAAAA